MNPKEYGKMLITRVVEFSAAHKLYREELSWEQNLSLFDKCANPNGHGHNYTLEATFAGPIDPQTGMVVHFQSLKRLLEETVVQPLDHRNLNSDVPFLEGKLPTSENLVLALWKEISHSIKGQPWQLHRLRVGATSHNWVEYYGEGENSRA